MPALLATAFFRQRWVFCYGVMMATMLVDLDHLLADPVYDSGRCSIGFHPLHEPVMIGAYLLLTGPRKTRFVGIGLLIHMALDSIDCQLTGGVWLV